MDNINDIISSLSSEDIETLKGVASSILGSSDNSNSKSSENDIQNAAEVVGTAQNIVSAANSVNSLGLTQSDFNMMMKAKNIIDKMNSSTSKNADLINALKPHLSAESQKKADRAIRILKLFEVLPYLKDLF